jgi:hypothetical protein
MNHPNFQTMNLKELRAYLLSHREDEKVFQTYVDRIHNESNWVEVPFCESLDELEAYPDFAEKLRQDSGRKK